MNNLKVVEINDKQIFLGYFKGEEKMMREIEKSIKDEGIEGIC